MEALLRYVYGQTMTANLPDALNEQLEQAAHRKDKGQDAKHPGREGNAETGTETFKEKANQPQKLNHKRAD